MELVEIRSQLLTWFDTHRRDLPWRRTKDPYAIWLSEVMLQQTQVKTVVPYWERFLSAFPTVHALARAPLPDVLALWRGLGYYSRARHLHQASRDLVRDHAGQLPSTARALMKLPGFGRYTAGAVASIAFGETTPVVDGNVFRVLSRLCALTGNRGDRDIEARVWSIAGEWVDPRRPGDWNQALMELGATICRTADPLCLLCPLAPACQARRLGLVQRCSSPKPQPKRNHIHWSVAVLRRKDRLLFARRHESGLFGGLWEMPVVELDPRTSDRSQLHQALGRLWQKRIGIPFKVVRPLGTVHRTLTHRELTLHLFQVCSGGTPRSLDGYSEVRWVNEDDARTLAVSTAMSKALEAAVQALEK